jgi:hypothetical protein
LLILYLLCRSRTASRGAYLPVAHFSPPYSVTSLLIGK